MGPRIFFLFKNSAPFCEGLSICHEYQSVFNFSWFRIASKPASTVSRMQHSFHKAQKSKGDLAFLLLLSLNSISPAKCLSPFFPLFPSSLCVTVRGFSFFIKQEGGGTEPIPMTARNKLVFFTFRSLSVKKFNIYTYIYRWKAKMQRVLNKV